MCPVFSLKTCQFRSSWLCCSQFALLLWHLTQITFFPKIFRRGWTSRLQFVSRCKSDLESPGSLRVRCKCAMPKKSLFLAHHQWISGQKNGQIHHFGKDHEKKQQKTYENPGGLDTFSTFRSFIILSRSLKSRDVHRMFHQIVGGLTTL